MAGSMTRALRRRLRATVWTLQGLSADEQRALRRIVESGLFDLSYYELQAGRRFRDAGAAARHFLQTGEASGWSPSYLYDGGWYSTRAHRITRPFDHFLRTGQTQAAAGPHFDARRYLDLHPEASSTRGGPLGHFMSGANDETLTIPPADGALPMPVGAAKAALAGLILPEPTAADRGSLARPQSDLSSVVVVGGSDWMHLHDAIASALLQVDEVVWVDHRTPFATAANLSARFLGEPRLRILRSAEGTWADAANLGASHTTGDVIVFVPGDMEARRGWAEALVTRLHTDTDAAGAQALVLDDRDLIHQMPGDTLEGFPVHDGARLMGTPSTDLRGCFAVRRAALAEQGGLHDDVPFFSGGSFVVEPQAEVTLFDDFVLPQPHAPLVVHEKGPQLRWAIKLPAHAGLRGDVWGDVAFAEDLAAALRSLGQDVVSDRRLAHHRPTSDHLDDVTLTIRGPIRYEPRGDATHVLWVISHPEEVTPAEVSSFDLAYAAGPGWATDMGIRTLLQATDPDRFNPDVAPMADLDVLFVGRPRSGVFRPIVRDAIEVGSNLSVFGEAWHRHIDPKYVVADYLPNSELPSAYRGARIVLNDHWDDMRRLGFYSNRLFDAVAVGAKVISDPIDGVEDIFGESVQVYRSVDELRELLDPATSRWPSADELAANAERIRQQHSFAARAKQLLHDVLQIRSQ